MSRYIDADAVLKSIGASEHCKDCECIINNYECRGHSLSRQDICDIVDAIPTADVVEVVRCKDCRHNYEHETPMGNKFHLCNINKLAFTQYADFYCAYGERREDERE